MVRNRGMGAVVLAAIIFVLPAAVRAGDAGGDVGRAEIEDLKKEIASLRRQMDDRSRAVVHSPIEKAVAGRFGPDQEVTTKEGKLTIGGLVQVWYYTIENDNEGLFQDNDINGIPDTNEHADNDSFRIRRTELNFTIDVHENVSAYIMIDPAREAISFPDLNGGFKRANNVAPEFDAVNGPGLGSTGGVSSVQFGTGAFPNLLQDALINFHGVVPHHDFTVGQFLPTFSEEDFRPSGQLDFVERSFIGNRFARDLGVTIHGSWWKDCDGFDGGPYQGAGDSGRFQYWLTAYNGAGNYHQSGGQSQNRADDNDEKDFLATLMIRPLWSDSDCSKWGRLELGYSGGFGMHGESSTGNQGADDPINNPLNGLNRHQAWAIRHSAWLWYRPGGPVRGVWLRGEYQAVKDRNAPGSVIDLQGAGGTDIGNTGSGSGFGQSDGNPFWSRGFYGAIGYKLSESIFADCNMPSWLKPFEFAVRYQQYENVETADLVSTNQTDVFQTKMWTLGANYYIKGHNAKIQANYNFIDLPEADSGARTFHNVRNDSFVVNFQVAF